MKLYIKCSIDAANTTANEKKNHFVEDSGSGAKSNHREQIFWNLTERFQHFEMVSCEEQHLSFQI